jgi:thioredoxin reductase (NADPH)
MEQIKQFEPGFCERLKLSKTRGWDFIVTSNKGTLIHASVVAIAGGLGSFEPRKPLIDGINFMKTKEKYFIKDPKNLEIKESLSRAVETLCFRLSIFLADIASEVTLIHRRNEFRGALDSVEKVQELKDLGKIRLITQLRLWA